jgi:hypothetical protein
MSPFRRRKSRESRARARRQQLVQRERQAYGRGRAGPEAEPPTEPIEPQEEIVEEPVEAMPQELVEEPVEAMPQELAEDPVEAPPQDLADEPTARREFQRTRAAAPREVEAKPRRRRTRRHPLAGLRSASTRGARATAEQVTPGIGRAGSRLGAFLGWLVAWPLRLAALLERLARSLLSVLAALGSGTLAFAERHLTPERVLVLVTTGAAACLIGSQFTAYRGVEVGQPQYSSVSAVAPAPQTDRIDAGAAHAYILIPLAVIAVVIAVVALVTGRWRLTRLISLIGLAGIAVSLAIDLPKGLDAGTAGVAFAGAKATLTDGFYVQLAASAVLVLCGWVLGTNLRQRDATPTRRRAPRSEPRPHGTASVAGGGA